MRLGKNQTLLKAVLASSLFFSYSVYAIDITTDTTTAIVVDPTTANFTNVNIKAVGGSITVTGTPAITVNPTTTGLTSTITVENSRTLLPADITSDNQSIFVNNASANTLTLNVNVQQGGSLLTTGNFATIDSVNTTTAATTLAVNTITLAFNNSGIILNTGTGAASRAVQLSNQLAVVPMTFTNNATGIIQSGPYALEAINLDGGIVPVTTGPVPTGTLNFTNAGSIIAPGGRGIAYTTGALANFVNSGNISALGTAIDFNSQLTNVTLAGGTVNSNAPTAYAVRTAGTINITGGTVVGILQGAASLLNINLSPGATFSTGGNLDSFSTINVNSGTLNLANNVTTSGNVVLLPGATLSANLNVAVPGFISAANSTSTLAFDLTSNAVFGQITTGAGTAIGTAQVVITNRGNGYISNGTVFTVLNAPAMTVAGGEPTYTLPVSAVYGFSAVRSTNTINVSVSRKPFNAFASTGESGRLIRGVANSLEILGQTTTNASVLQAIGELGRLPSAAQVEDGLKQLVPNVNYMSTTAVVQATNDAMTKMRARMRLAALSEDEAGYAAGEMGEGPAFWAEPYGSHAVQRDRKGIYGYRLYTLGVIAGVDSAVTDTVRLGFSGAYSGTKSRTRRAARTDLTIDAYQLSVYAAKSIGCGWVEGALSYARLGYSGIRRIQFGAINARATNDHHGSEWAINLGHGHHFVTQSGIDIMPSLGLNWAHVVENSYIERGAAGLNLEVNSHTVDEVDASASLKLATTWMWGIGKVVPDVVLGLNYTLWDDPEKVSASFLQTGPTFRVVGIKDERIGAMGGLGLTWFKTDTLSFKANYEASVKKHYFSYSGGLSVRYMF